MELNMMKLLLVNLAYFEIPPMIKLYIFAKQKIGHSIFLNKGFVFFPNLIFLIN